MRCQLARWLDEDSSLEVANAMRTKAAQGFSFQPRLRIRFGDTVALGPGKVELLQRVRESGSITEAAKQMSMSYMRAWSLIQTMNQCFQEPVVYTARGGRKRGGTRLTLTGEQLLALYQQMESECLAATGETQKELASMLKKTA